MIKGNDMYIPTTLNRSMHVFRPLYGPFQVAL